VHRRRPSRCAVISISAPVRRSNGCQLQPAGRRCGLERSAAAAVQSLDDQAAAVSNDCWTARAARVRAAGASPSRGRQRNGGGLRVRNTGSETERVLGRPRRNSCGPGQSAGLLLETLPSPPASIPHGRSQRQDFLSSRSQCSVSRMSPLSGYVAVLDRWPLASALPVPVCRRLAVSRRISNLDIRESLVRRFGRNVC